MTPEERRERRRLYQKAYYEEHKDEINARRSEARKGKVHYDYESNREYQKKYKEEHKEKLNEYYREYYKKNVHRIKERNRALYEQRKKEKLLGQTTVPGSEETRED